MTSMDFAGFIKSPKTEDYYEDVPETVTDEETGEEKTILFGLTGTGYFDMVAYQKYNDGEMSDYIPTDADLQQGFDGLPKVD